MFLCNIHINLGNVIFLEVWTLIEVKTNSMELVSINLRQLSIKINSKKEFLSQGNKTYLRKLK